MVRTVIGTLAFYQEGGASFSFGCSWSYYMGMCKFAKSNKENIKKFRLSDKEHEAELEDTLQNLATDLAPLYRRMAPVSYGNQVAFESVASDCRIGHPVQGGGRPFSAVTGVVDFCAHAHRDTHNMNAGCTVVLTLTKPENRPFSTTVAPDDEQLHVLPHYIPEIDQADPEINNEAYSRKHIEGSVKFLEKFHRTMVIRSKPLEKPTRRRSSRLMKRSLSAARGAEQQQQEQHQQHGRLHPHNSVQGTVLTFAPAVPTSPTTTSWRSPAPTPGMTSPDKITPAAAAFLKKQEQKVGLLQKAMAADGRNQARANLDNRLGELVQQRQVFQQQQQQKPPRANMDQQVRQQPPVNPVVANANASFVLKKPTLGSFGGFSVKYVGPANAQASNPQVSSSSSSTHAVPSVGPQQTQLPSMPGLGRQQGPASEFFSLGGQNLAAATKGATWEAGLRQNAFMNGTFGGKMLNSLKSFGSQQQQQQQQQQQPGPTPHPSTSSSPVISQESIAAAIAIARDSLHQLDGGGDCLEDDIPQFEIRPAAKAGGAPPPPPPPPAAAAAAVAVKASAKVQPPKRVQIRAPSGKPRGRKPKATAEPVPQQPQQPKTSLVINQKPAGQQSVQGHFGQPPAASALINGHDLSRIQWSGRNTVEVTPQLPSVPSSSSTTSAQHLRGLLPQMPEVIPYKAYNTAASSAQPQQNGHFHGLQQQVQKHPWPQSVQQPQSQGTLPAQQAPQQHFIQPTQQQQQPPAHPPIQTHGGMTTPPWEGGDGFCNQHQQQPQQQQKLQQQQEQQNGLWPRPPLTPEKSPVKYDEKSPLRNDVESGVEEPVKLRVEETNNEEIFSDASMGGLAIALTHGYVRESEIQKYFL